MRYALREDINSPQFIDGGRYSGNISERLNYPLYTFLFLPITSSLESSRRITIFALQQQILHPKKRKLITHPLFFLYEAPENQ